MNSILKLIATAVVIDCVASNWEYSGEKGPLQWSNDFANCGGMSQSPINIMTNDATLDSKLGTFQRKWFENIPKGMLLKNNGHSAQVDVTDGLIINDKSVLPGDYQLVQFHYHWGSNPTSGGSEHTLNGKRYFGEMHMVFWNKKYGKFTSAISKKGDGLAVLGFLIEATYPQDNCAFDRVFGHLSNVGSKDATKTYQTSELFSLETLLPNDMSEYYRYSGSLTTPTCDESVVWTVFKDPILISKAQARKIADSLRDGTNTSTSSVIRNNYRPTQPLNGRIVNYNAAETVHVSLFLTVIGFIINLAL